jgi:formylglycine-generating enzyme required for sulfatase activity
MRDAGLANTHDGVHLLATEMPAERGGRLHRDPGDGRWRALPGFGEHPVYWVTWIAGAAYAVCQGARLPTHAELDAVSVGVVASNCDYRIGDVAPVREPDRGPGRVHHLVGNVQVWCADGPTLDASLPAERYLHGAAWNTPGTPADIARVRSRHLLGSSRGVGIRLVRDPDRPVPALDPVQVSARLRQWLDTLTGQALADRHRALGDPDRAVIDDLHGPLPPAPDP